MRLAASQEAWWEDANDPTIRLLSPGKAAALVKMMAAVVTGAAPQMGDDGKVDL